VSNIPEEELPYYYNAASVFVLPSLYEPASIALLESLTSEIPTIASRVGGIQEMMKDTGIYVKPKDSAGIAKGIEWIMKNKKATEKLSEKGRKLMVKEHDWNNIAKEYETLFEGLIRN
jgi:glycosyltransferase involved in cell wall biosynthesis